MPYMTDTSGYSLLKRLAACQQRSISGSGSGRRRQRVPAGKSEVANFNCPEDFGYYPHASDCTQYYVCVFGGALQESCTGGLVYSHELQTCDWPRNVVCNLTSAGSGVSTVRITDPRTQSTNSVRGATEPLTPSVGSFDVRFQNSLPASQSLRASESFSVFETNDKSRHPKFLRQESEPQQSLTRFPQQSFFADTAVQESSRRPVNVSPTTFRPVVFPPSQPDFRGSHTSRPSIRPAPTPSPSIADDFYGDYNLTDADLFYYYDYYDYYDVATTSTTTSRPPLRRVPVTSSPTRQPSRIATPAPAPQRQVPVISGPISVDDSIPKRPGPVRSQPPVDVKAAKCDPKICRLPDCYCGGKDVPGGFAPESVPQLVLLTFDDAVNDLNKGLYRDLFEVGRTNPNGCPIASTMYVSHEWTDYTQVQNLYADGHEIASHSVSHSFGEQFSTKKWAKEIAGQREILAAYGGVKMEDVRGMRAPFLAVGGNKMFKMLYDQNFTYDSSMPVYENKPPSWPYTLDYKIFHDCMIPPCPTNSYPATGTIMVQLQFFCVLFSQWVLHDPLHPSVGGESKATKTSLISLLAVIYYPTLSESLICACLSFNE
ncbi:Polysaccharide deacetylase [Halocaridina rubra]|uniref:Polysaccharide deacetylase n=1 Tax=Halocaridina rubra TaxID=373956 RepID=A0AAN8WDK3_HALRR